MKNIQSIEFYAGSKEELLPGFTSDFPYIASCVELDKYMGHFVPWHWHKTVELFYMESGILEYRTPRKSLLFPAGSGGLINSNVLHMTKSHSETHKTIQLIHIFDTSFLAGEPGSKIEQKYIMPITTASQLDILPLYPDNPIQADTLNLIHNAFLISERETGYEIKLREALSNIWLALFRMAAPLLGEKGSHDKANDKIKQMMIYIHEHYTEKISIPQIAASAFLSERECFRVFRDCLHTTPAEYLKSYRLQMARQMLAKTKEPISSICYACGLGSSSYFGKVFREYMGCTPLEYRIKWQNNDILGQKKDI